jgi:hypothetical protein
VHLRALSVDAAGNVYATGHTVAGKNPSRPCEPAREVPAPAEIRGSQSDAILIQLSDGGRRLSYVARFGGPGNQEGRAAAATADGQWVFVAGQTDSSGSEAIEHSGINREMVFIAALQPCRTGAFYFRVVPEAIDINVPGIAFGPALDAFATAETRFGATQRQPSDAKSPVFIPIAPACQAIAR